jgi:hypothetical protein
MADVILRRRPISSNVELFTFHDGVTVQDLVERLELPEPLHDYLVVTVDGVEVLRPAWRETRPSALSRVYVAPVPAGGGGGKSIFAAIAAIAVSIFASWAAPAILGAGASPLAVGALQAGIMFVGALIINALFAPPRLRDTGQGERSSSPFYGMQGQRNQARAYGAVRSIYGYMRVAPDLAAEPYILTSGDTQTLFALYDFGYGGVQVDDIRIGGTPWWQYRGIDLRVYSHYRDGPLALFSNDHTTEQFNVEVRNSWVERSTVIDDAHEITVEIGFPQGLIGYNKEGKAINESALFRLDVGLNGNWIPATSLPHYTSHGISSVVQDSYDATIIFQAGRTPPPAGTHNACCPGYSWLIGAQTFTITADGPGLGPGLRFWYDGQQYTVAAATYHGFRDLIEYDSDGNATSFQRVYDYTITLDRPIPQSAVLQDYWGIVISAGFNYGWNPYYANNARNQVTVRMDPDPVSAWRLTRATQEPFVFSITIGLPQPGRWSVRVMRTDSIDYLNNESSTVKHIDKSVLTGIRSSRYDSPLAFSRDHTIIEMRVTATDQLTGMVDTLTADCRRWLNTWDGGIHAWKHTTNPAWIAYDLLTGISNPDPLPASRIDLQSFIKFAAFCDRPSPHGPAYHTFSANWQDEATIAERLMDVLGTARASLTYREGKYAVIWESFPTVPAQLFTPANSWGFTGAKTFTKQPHALKVSWVDPSSEWQMVETHVYADGYSAANAQYFEAMQLPYTTNWAEAWREGRYFLAVGKLRPESFKLITDVENLLCERGDLIRVQHDVARSGGVPARIKAINGAVVTLTEAVPWNAVDQFRLRLRYDDNTQDELAVVDQPGTHDLTLATAPAKAKVGDLVVYGRVDFVTDEFLVKAIKPGGELTAELTLVPISRAIAQADTGAIPEYRPPISGDIGTSMPCVEWVRFTASLTYRDRIPMGTVLADWPPVKGAAEYEVWVDLEGRGNYRRHGAVREAGDYLVLDEVNTLSASYPAVGNVPAVKVLPRSALGYRPALESCRAWTFDVLRDTATPGRPRFFSGNVSGRVMYLTWLPPDDPDIGGYVIRWTPELISPSWVAATNELEILPHDSVSAQVNARVGSYLIKTIDTSGHYSTEYAVVRTTIPALEGINYVTSRVEHPGFTGHKDRVELVGNAIRLERTAAGCSAVDYGVYYFADWIDIGDIERCYLQASVSAYGDECIYMASWLPNIAAIDPIAATGQDDYAVEVQVRTATHLSEVMADWKPAKYPQNLASVNPIGFRGTDSDWSGWQRLTAGYYTGRYFQFRVILATNDRQVSPAIYGLSVSLDMPERTVAQHDVAIAAGGTRIIYPGGGFYAVPAIGTTHDDALAGDTLKISGADKFGFDAEIFDQAGASKAGQIDYVAVGYGQALTAMMPAVMPGEDDLPKLFPRSYRHPTMPDITH